MIITCEACNTRYDVNEDLIKPQGTKMRCSACGKVFTAYPGPVSDESSSVEVGLDQLEETTGFEETAESVTDESGFETYQETETEEIDLDELEKTTAFEESEMVSAGADEYTDDDFGDLDLEETETFEDDLEGLLGDFDEDAGDEDAGLETQDEDGTKEIGMTDLEKTLAADFGGDESAAGREAALGEDLDEEDDEEFDLDLDITAEEEPGIDQDSAEAGALEEEFELDLDIEEPDAVDAQKDDEEFEIDLVESDDMPEATEALEQMDTEEFGFDLEEDDSAFDSFEEETKAAEDAEKATDDFAVELDLGAADEPDAMEEETAADADQETLDFDLDDLDEFEEKTAESAVAEGEEVDIDFDLDLDLEEADQSGKTADEQEDTVSAEEDEFDLTDVEAFLDMEHETREQTADDDDLEEFDLGFDIDEERSPEETAAERDFDIDLEAVDEAMKPTGETMETIAMETSVEDRETASPEMVAAPVAGKTEPSPAKPAGERPGEEPAVVSEPATKAAAEAAKKPEKSNALRAALIILLILAIAGGGYFYIMATREPAPEPDAVAPPPVEAVDPDGNLQMAISTPTYMFINNETAGALLVVTGSVTNRYDHTREQVRVQGNLYDGDGELVHSSAPVYTGMLFETDELETLALPEIESALTGPDAPGVDVAVDPDATESFMVVFSEIPDEVAEMNVEVVASESGG